jgi:hypothetical protein
MVLPLYRRQLAYLQHLRPTCDQLFLENTRHSDACDQVPRCQKHLLTERGHPCPLFFCGTSPHEVFGVRALHSTQLSRRLPLARYQDDTAFADPTAFCVTPSLSCAPVPSAYGVVTTV